MAKFFQRGVDAYKAQCANGGIHIKAAERISDRPMYVFPPTLSDIANYSLGGKPELNLAGCIAARARNEDGTQMFITEKEKLQAIKELTTQMSPEQIGPVADEILAAFGETGEHDALEVDDPRVNVLEDESVTHHTPTVEEAEGNSTAA